MIVNVTVIAELPNITFFKDSCTMGLLHPVTVSLVFMFAKRTFMRFTDRNITEFYLFLISLYNEIAVATNGFFFCCCCFPLMGVKILYVFYIDRRIIKI